MIFIVLIFAVAYVTAAEKDLKQLEKAKPLDRVAEDLTTEEQRIRFYRVVPVRFVRVNTVKKPVASNTASGYSGYRSGYGAFRGRRSLFDNKSLSS